ncbi:uncharacterized protein LOC102704320 [Oryza brachyantha]|nr:uncharacterized protein LOC102704320 [Oryza brachyantha]
MGAKVEGDNYMLGYYAMGDFNIDANGRWSPYHEEKTSNGHMCNGFIAKPTNVYSEYDKEMLTRTMLEHEAIFRQQVYELHRVYKIQRDMMKQYQNKDIYAYPMLEDASKTNSPTVPPNGAKMIWPIQTPPMSITYRKAPIAEHGVMNHSLKFLREGSVQSSPNGFPPSDALNAKQGTFDLQLSADHYVDDDNASENDPIDFLGVASEKKPQNNADLTLVSPEGLGRFSDNSSTSGLHATNNLGGRQVVDLNEPITGTYMGRANGPGSRGLSYTMENSWHQSILRPSTANINFNKEYSKEKHLDEGTSSNFFATNAKTKQEEKLLIDKGKQVSSIHVFTPRYSDATQMSMKGVDGRSASNTQFLHQGQNSSAGWFARSSLEAPAINNFPRLDRLHHSSLGALGAPMTAPRIDHPSGASPIGSCTLDPRSSAVNNATFQPIPSFKGSSTVNQSIGTSVLKVKKNDGLDGSCPGFALDPFCESRSRHQVTISSDEEQTECLMFEHSARHCEDPHFANDKGPKNFNLNEALSDGQEDCLVEQDGGSVSSLAHSKAGGSVLGFPWLMKTTDTCTRPSDLQNPRKVFTHSNRTVIDLNNNDRKEIPSTIHSLSDSASTSLDCGVKKESQDCGVKKDELCEDITTRTQLVCNTTQESATCLPFLCQKYAPGDDKAAKGVDKKSGAPVRNFIDLNDDAPNEDNSESSVVSHECHVASLQNNHGKRKFVIDLEVPACEEGAAWTFNQECTPSDKLDATQEADDAYFTSTRIAAESIVALSMHVPTIAETSDDMLQWFADFAVSSTDYHDEQAEVQDCTNNSSDDGPDSFESLTLKLEETNIDEYWSRPRAPEIPNDEQAGQSVNLLTKPKRGPQRRRRQKRDFQKDILPGLTSLARPEIVEDIQLLEGLVQASGGSWQSSLTRRGRYGGRPRGRKPRKILSETIEEEEVLVTPPAKPDAADIEASDRGIIGWGRTTRRCRRPRCPPGYNISAAS